MGRDFELSAIGYIQMHGAGACFKIKDDISRAIGMGDWDEAHRLQCTQSAISRLQDCEQMSLRLAAEKRGSYG